MVQAPASFHGGTIRSRELRRVRLPLAMRQRRKKRLSFVSTRMAAVVLLLSLKHVASLLSSNIATTCRCRSARITSVFRQNPSSSCRTAVNVNNVSNNNHEYSSFWENLLLQEHQEIVHDFRERRRHWSRSRLEESGMSIFGATAEPDSELFGEKIVRIHKPGLLFWNDKFTRGDVLLMILNDETSRDALVVQVGKDWMNVAVGATWPAGLWESRKQGASSSCTTVRLDRTAPHAPLRAQQMALDLVRRGKGGESAALMASMHYYCTSSTTGVRHEEDKDLILKVAAEIPSRLSHLGSAVLKDTIKSALAKTKRATTFQPNKSQEEAIIWALQRKSSLVQGPAGTGKSRVAALLVATALKLQPNQRILAVAHSNGAADVFLEALLQMKIPALRVGRPASVSASLQHRTVTALTEKHPEVVRCRAMARDMKLSQQERSAAKHGLRQSISNVQRSILKTAPVVVTSCIGAHQLLEDASEALFPLVVLDEAAQTTEPAFVCALVAARAEQIVLVGDTCQLPPTVSSMELRKSLGVSPMARLEDIGVDQKTLRVQYRMAPALLEHPSRYFYKGLVVCADECLANSEQAPPAGFPWPTQLPLAFVHVGGDLEVTHGSGGKSNPTEATLVANIVSGFINEGGIESSEIAVISPYSKQAQRIRTELAVRQHGEVQVGTVDSYQGQERNVVVISCVRSNSNAELGFLRDSRRLCVAITRARRALVVVGDRKVLQTCRHWAALLDSFETRGVAIRNVDCELVESAATLQKSYHAAQDLDWNALFAEPVA